ncbi:efflux RND transporter periplasmic adaptor subunit [Rahnella aquatilis]|jgi:RND family efflux transporter MFP subunit|uniref:efflux RND transporter periplasmic adaptor subunit n=1 Tax=Rahnella sp. (strain Y9602) TaxID=2703885 RepID=UPI000F7BE7B7|nr:efflux RND transporter periplasmic adaptor subunit [Rahnella aceris]AZP41746.1 efflux RND transporter periplasmic adaptor subunit [Rahnella aquatilis]AZP46087.1 efflux RND transporter periplasmic adaptor subunit [Rahnella aquatilis]MBU9841556.1 efflux RND transporter periplasmic adaptor subunit [Rahnella aceris]UNK54891.1 efflux RND transporter periplasmic adaptor subunit [Rahnella aceris]
MAVTFTDYARHAIRHLSATGRMLPFIPAACLIIVAIVLTGCGDKAHKQAPSVRPVRTISAPPPVALSSLIQTGEIRAHEEVTLGFRLDGRILTRQAEVGDRVIAGQVLATQESETSRNQFSSAQADLNSARAAEQVAALSLRRMQLLMPSGAIARSQLDSAQADWQAARAKRQSSEDALKNAQENVSWTKLTAPADGVITQVSASAGQVVSAGQSVITLASGSLRDAVFDVADPQSVPQQADSLFTISLLSAPSGVAQGHFRDVSPQADPQTRTWRLRITLDNPPPAMALGASVQLTLNASGPRLIALPASALTRSGDKPAVFVVDEKTLTLHLRPVDIGRYSTSEIFLSAGVQPGERVVIAGVSKLREGEKVMPGEDSE